MFAGMARSVAHVISTLAMAVEDLIVTESVLGAHLIVMVSQLHYGAQE
jgi:hypothetical protein